MKSKRLKGWLTTVGLIITIIAVAGSILSCNTSSPPDPTPSPLEVAPEVGKLAPDFTLATLTGSEITLSELRGMPVVLNFWATWCGYCVAELGYFDAVAKQKSGEMTVVAIDVGQDTSKVKKFFGDYEISFTVALDKDLAVASRYAARRYLPVTFLIDSDGVIRNKKVGAFRSEAELWDSLRSLS